MKNYLIKTIKRKNQVTNMYVCVWIKNNDSNNNNIFNHFFNQKKNNSMKENQILLVYWRDMVKVSKSYGNKIINQKNSQKI